jgi:flagellar biosynthetic protein FlhB
MAEHDEKTEQATPRKRQKVREQGQVARSKDLISMFATGGVLLSMYVGGKYMAQNSMNLTQELLRLDYGSDFLTVIRTASVKAMIIMSPFLIMAFFLAIGAGFLQGGFVLKSFSIKLDHVNPINGLKRIFSFSGLIEFLKSLLKFSVGIYVVYIIIRKDLTILPRLMEMNERGIALTFMSIVLKAVTYGFLCFFVIAVADYFLQRLIFERSIRMSRQELKEEYKESEGDPQIRARIKSIQRQLAMKRMMQEVPKATVVVTNPTHLAVALKYEGKEMSAPKVVAKGAENVAEKIKEIARKNGVPIIEDKPLARLLFKLEIGSFIPEELYRAVAKILAYVYKMRGAA